MSYCLNPDCQNLLNPDGATFCLACGTKLLLDNRYIATKFLGTDDMGRNFIAVDECTPTLKRCVIKQFFPAPQVLSNLTMHKKANLAVIFISG